MTDFHRPSTLSSRKAALAALALLALAIPGAFAQEVAAPGGSDPTSSEIQKFCTNIADAARDQRYLLQKKELTDLQAQVDERIAILEKRKAEYEDWLKRRNDFLQQAEVGLVGIYKTMKADAAAGKLELVEPEIAAAILMKLPARQSSLILSEMKNEKAAKLTDLISAASDPNTSKEPS